MAGRSLQAVQSPGPLHVSRDTRRGQERILRIDRSDEPGVSRGVRSEFLKMCSSLGPQLSP